MKTYMGFAYTTLLVLFFGLGNSHAQKIRTLSRGEVASIKESLKGLSEDQYTIKLIEPNGKGGAIEKTYGKMDWKTIDAGQINSGVLLTPFIQLNKIRLQKLQIVGPGCFDIIRFKDFKDAYDKSKVFNQYIVKYQKQQ